MLDFRLLRRKSTKKHEQPHPPAALAGVKQVPQQHPEQQQLTPCHTPEQAHTPSNTERQHRRVSDVSATSYTNFSDDFPATPSTSTTTPSSTTTAPPATIHIREISYTTISLVIESWEMAKHRLQYQFESIMGARIMNNLFQLAPSAQLVFAARNTQIGDSSSSFPSTSTMEHDQLKLQLIHRHASVMVSMLEAILSFVGPDTETIGEMLQDLGKQHARLGVKPSHVVMLATAVVKSLESELGQQYFDARHASAWMHLLQVLSEGLTLAMVSNCE